jgi:hypothetical protein
MVRQQLAGEVERVTFPEHARLVRLRLIVTIPVGIRDGISLEEEHGISIKRLFFHRSFGPND